ncbi:MAG: hypothetical protein WA441_00880 [Methyloceanibacter sp.]
MTDLPEKLEPDGIVEALLEVQFTSKVLPELLIGLLASGPTWLGVSAITPGLDVGLPNADQALHCIVHAEILIACRQTGRARLWTRPFH